MITITPEMLTVMNGYDDADFRWNGDPYELMGKLVGDSKIRCLGKYVIAKIRGSRGRMLVHGWVRGKERVGYGSYNYLVECEVDRKLHRCGMPQIIEEGS